MLEEEEKRIKLQQKLARQQKGSNRYRKTLKRINKTYQYERNVCNDVAHKASHEVVSVGRSHECCEVAPVFLKISFSHRPFLFDFV